MTLGGFQPQTAREILRRLAIDAQHPLNADQTGYGNVTSSPGISFRNDDATQAPSYGVMLVTGIVLADDGREFYKVTQPTTTLGTSYLVNGYTPVDSGGFGQAQVGPKYKIAYDSGTPAYGEGWGIKASQWTLSKGWPGPTIVDGIFDSQAKVLLGSFGTSFNVAGKSASDIPALSGSTPGSGGVTAHGFNGSAMFATTMTFTGLNLSGTAAKAARYLQFKPMYGKWFVDFESCT